MHLLATPFPFIEIAVFTIALIAFLLTVRFFVASQKRLENLLPDTKRKKIYNIGIDRDGFIVPATKHDKKTVKQSTESDAETKHELRELRGMLQLQQLELSRAVNKIADLTTTKKVEYEEEDYTDEEEEDKFDDSSYNPEIEQLYKKLEEKETELKEIRQQDELSQKLQGHFEEVQSGYEELQLKVQKMEQQAWQAAELAIKLDNIEQSHLQLEKTIAKKEGKVLELSIENGRLHEALNEAEDKLSEANLQRQQLSKKVQFLEEINSDIQQMSDANRKLKNELRRVAELESMLNLITEERDVLLKRRTARF